MEKHYFWAFIVIALIAGASIGFSISNTTITGKAFDLGDVLPFLKRATQEVRPFPECGNGVCDEIENLVNCPADCHVCGDDICTRPYENENNCRQDCKPVIYISDCAVLDQAGATYVLTKDIINTQRKTCIKFAANNITLDCQRSIIDGINSQESLGIHLFQKSNSIIENCIITNFKTGIHLLASPNNILRSNIVKNNYYGGIWIDLSPNNILRNNSMNNNKFNFYFEGDEHEISHYYQDIDTSNKVDGKPLYYYNGNCADFTIPPDAGFVGLISCRNITVENLILTNNSHGILLYNTNKSIMINNVLNSNRFGILNIYSHNNNWTNNVANYNVVGLYIDFSLNNFLTNNKARTNKYGLYICEGSHNNSIINNIMKLNEQGIYIHPLSNDNIFISNDLCKNLGGYDIYDLNSNFFSNNYCDYLYTDRQLKNCTYPCFTRTCSEIGGTVCLENEICNSQTVTAVDTVNCCIGNCILKMICNKDGICQVELGENCGNCYTDCPCLQGQRCINDKCIASQPDIISLIRRLF